MTSDERNFLLQVVSNRDLNEARDEASRAINVEVRMIREDVERYERDLKASRAAATA